MRYRVLSDKFVYRNETNDTISLVIKETSQILYLNSEAKKIILQNGEQDLEDLLNELNLSPEDKVEAEKDFNNMIYELECEQIIEVLDRGDKKQSKENELKVAGESDYIAISSFMKKNYTKQCNYALVKYEKYYHITNVRSRQFNNYEYNIVKYENQKVVANFVVAPPNSGVGFSVTLINTLVFEEGIEEEKKDSLIKEFLDFCKQIFSNESSKLRFYNFEGIDAFYKKVLVSKGFKSTCILEKEIAKSIDLEYLDLFI